ncbi:hypothetical protein BGZ90_002792 [Linnemannia elongata]|nr:hypothetical protein BGZ90_002792 [Linnemannia elongata]
MVVPPPSAVDTVAVGHNTTAPVRATSMGSLGKANPLKNIIRRKSLELGRFFDGSAGSSSQRGNNGSKASLEQDASPSTPPLISLDINRAGTPTPISPPRLTTRRPNFTLGLPWRPQSEYFSQGTPGVQTSLSKTQKRFIRAFPELADLAKVPAAYCLPCLATPPHTPLEHPLTPGSTSMSPSNTLSTLTSSVFSTTSSTTTLACPGHFHDYSCALEREILWQGTLYVAATHVCFYGKHFGKTVKVIIDYRDLILIEREKKMGVFPSSIRLRVSLVETNSPTSAALDPQETKGNTNTNTNNDAGAAEPKIPATTKDYVLTSLMSREQAFADIERNWQAYRHFQKSACANGLPTPQLESPGGSEKNLAGLVDSGDGRGTTLGLDSRVKPWTILDRHKIPRTYSVISDEAFSSSENLDRPHLRERASTSLIRPSTVASHEHIGSWRAAAAATGASSDHPSISSRSPASASEGRRGSVASIGSSDKQELTSGLIGFLQRRSSLVHKWKKSESGGGSNFSDSSSEAAQDLREDVTPSPVDVSLAATAVSTTQPSTLQDSPLLAAQRQDGTLRAPTPPPTLISPSLTTTKVSRSLSTVQTDAKPGSTHGMTKHIRGESSDGLQITPDERGGMKPGQAVKASTNSNNVNAIPSNFSTPPLPSGPVPCGCSRHYKNAVVSTVVPLPVDLCFEILFSGAGAGLGDNLGCDTHRIKDGSTDILITPWQHEDQPQDGNKVEKMGWVDQQRRLEYSVSFKVPMLAKTSTACFETQRVTHHEPFAILVHSESRTPNVPYGDHFSTVNQICMTWESEGKTRIKCFTEVKFKRSIMWSSKVEAGSLEGSGGFYKEFIRQLEQLVESQREQLLASYEAGRLTSSPTSSLIFSPVADDSDFALGTRASVQEPTQPGPQEMSRARSLLSQQFLRHPPSSTTAAGLSRHSLDSARPSMLGASSFVPQKSPLSTPVLPLEKKSALTVLLQSLTPPTYPVVPIAPEGEATISVPVSVSTGIGSSISPAAPLPPSSSSSPTSSWIDLVRRNMSLLGRASPTTSNSQHHRAMPSTGQSTLATSTFGHESARVVEKTGSPRVTFAVSTFPSAPSTPASPRSSESLLCFPKDHSTPRQGRRDHDRNHTRQHSSSRRLSKILLGFVILGLAVSALNIWYLFSVVSSMVEVVQLKEDVFQHQFYPLQASYHRKRRSSHSNHPIYRRRAGNHEPWKPSSSLVPGRTQQHSRRLSSSGKTTATAAPSFTAPKTPTIRSSNPQKHLFDETLLDPLQTQTAILRTEITELFDLLELARKELHQPHHQHHHRS